MQGKLDPDNFAGGSIRLDEAASKAALEGELGAPLGLDALEAAFGLTEVVDENMSNAARVHAVENGEDLSDYTMIAFGGAAPLHAARLSEKLGIRRCLIPPGAGVGSAIGFLRAPFSFEATRSVYVEFSAFDAALVADTLAELRTEATDFVRSCDANAPIEAEYKVYMRYRGQGWEIPVILTAQQAAQPDMETLKALFEADYTTLFGRTVAGLEIEATVWAVNASTPTPPVEPLPALSEAAGSRRMVPLERLQRAIFSTQRWDRPCVAAVVPREALAAGDRLAGPAAIYEDETTVIVPTSRSARIQPDGCIDLTSEEEG